MNKQVICEVAGTFYGLDSGYVVSIEGGNATLSIPGSPEFVEGLTKFRNGWVPIINTRRLFNLDPGNDPEYCQVVYMKWYEGVIAIRIDKVVEISFVNENELQTLPIIIKEGRTAFIKGYIGHNKMLVGLVEHEKLLLPKETNMLMEYIAAMVKAEEEAEQRAREEEQRAQEQGPDEEPGSDEDPKS